MIRAAENAKSPKNAGSLLRPAGWRAALRDLLPEEWVFDPLEDEVLDKPNSAQGWFELAHAEQLRGYYEDAVDHYSAAIDLKPEFHEAFFERGCVQLARRQYEDAINDFSHAIKFEPSLVEAYSQRGIAKERLLLYEEAILDHNAALVLKGRPIRAKPRRSLTSELIGRATIFIQDRVLTPFKAFVEEKIRERKNRPSQTSIPKKTSKQKTRKKPGKRKKRAA